MPEMTGRVLIAQEGRLQVLDDAGAGHQFVLSAKAAAEPQQLYALQDQQARVRISYRSAQNLIALVAERIDVLEPEAAA